MKRILILGAGLSSSSLIRYLLHESEKEGWQVCVVDRDVDLVKRKLGNHPNGVALQFDATNSEQRLAAMASCDLVISMLPASFHCDVARDCLQLGKNLITPSYISQEMQELNAEAIQKGVLLMNETGVDPGIDHMSAMHVIHRLQEQGAEITAFKSFCGGLIAPESDDNPWHYKFTWNPRNVVLAGQGGASCFLDHNEYKYIPYNRLFGRLYPIDIKGYGQFDGYANRDSLAYRKTYGIEEVPTIFRGTLRRPHFCEAWNVFIELGMTDNSYVMDRSESLTPRNFINAFLPYRLNRSVEDKFRDFLRTERAHLYDMFAWLGLFEHPEPIGISNATPAQLLQHILEGKLVLNKTDKDMIVMHHEFDYSLNSNQYKLSASMVYKGEDQTYTAMSNTVGLPMGIIAKRMLLGQISLTGVHLPIQPGIYLPVLDELKTFGISFEEHLENIIE
jgi:saccharopine dehydrogenase-like NADP-dependent oxidoreductase